MNEHEPIAIIGIGCRFPGSSGPRELWDLLTAGGDAISEVPGDRFDIEEFYDPRPATPGKTTTRWGGFVDGVDEFDAGFFGIAPREAAKIDPQHRLLLEVAWEAVEDAGLTLESLSGSSAGVFMGVVNNDFGDRQFGGDTTALDVYSAAGSARSGAAGRISYALDLKGVSVALDAACSSGLVAVHMGCQSIRTGSCDVALAGGVNVILNPDHSVSFSQGGMMAPDGRCKAFDARADGYVRSEGAGVVVLKRLTAAIKDGDPVYAVIRGGASNNDGRSDLFMKPSVAGQSDVLRLAYQDAGVSPGAVDYVEAHGTGTSVGDPVELEALGTVLGEGRPQDRPLLVGSVKTNIGHLEAAAGLAGIIKVALALKHGRIPGNLHFETPNPDIPWDRLPVRVPTGLQPWPSDPASRFAGVSSFGIAGTNSHLVLQGPPAVGRAEPEANEADEADEADEANEANEAGEVPRDLVVTVSARSRSALRATAGRYAQALVDSDLTLVDVCHTLARRRTHHDFRLAVPCDSIDQAHAVLSAFGEGQVTDGAVTGTVTGTDNRTVWIFPGQGAQWPGMGTDLLGEPAFRESMLACADAMLPHLGWSVVDRLTSGEELVDVDVVQPVSFALQVSLAALWRSWGVTPDAVIGHSQGEIAAAHVAGALTLEDAALLVCGRSSLLKSVTGHGAMAAAAMSLEDAEKALLPYDGRVVVAAENGPESVVLAGDTTAVQVLVSALQAQDVFAQKVRVDYASHSSHMDALRAELGDVLSPVAPRPAAVAMYSTVTGTVLSGEELTCDYWIRNLRQPVLFRQAVERAAEDGHTGFLEISAHPLLVQATQQTVESLGHSPLVAGSLRRDEPGRPTLSRTLAAWHAAGRTVDWSARYLPRGEHVALPGYPWEHERHWNPAAERSVPVAQPSGGSPLTEGTPHPVMGRPTPLAVEPGALAWTFRLGLATLPYLAEHRVHGTTVFPATGYVELFLTAAAEATGATRNGDPVEIRDVRFLDTLFLDEDTSRLVQVLARRRDDVLELTCHVAVEEDAAVSEWVCLATARTAAVAGPPPASAPCPKEPEDAVPLSADEHYAAMRRRGVEHDGPFRAISAVRQAASHIVTRLDTTVSDEYRTPHYRVHPALADSFIQSMMPMLPSRTGEDSYLPTTIDRVVHRTPVPLGGTLRAHAERRSAADDVDFLVADLILAGADETTVLEVEGLRVQRLERELPQVTERRAGDLARVSRWERLAPLSKARGAKAQRWLVIGDGTPEATDLCRLMRERGGGCELLAADGPSLSERLPSALRAGPWAGVVCLAAPTTNAQGDLDQTATALTVLQAVAEAQSAVPPRVWLVTRGAHAVVPGDRWTSPPQAAVWGLGRTAMYELPDLRCSLVDLPADPGGADLRGLWNEISADADEDEIVLRGTSRFAHRLVAHPLTPSEPGPLFRDDSTYLVAGGLGGVGLRAARWMVEQGARHLVLLGRRGEHEALLPELEALRAKGASVHALRADIADRARLSKVLDWVRQNLPPLAGVINSAVVLDDRIVTQLDGESLNATSAPRIDGTRNLDELTADDPIDFFVLFSSAASLMGSPGQANYSAASAFMDAIAWNRRLRGRPALTVNWGRWDQIGIAARDTASSERFASRGLAAMSPDVAFNALGRLIGEWTPQAAVMSLDLEQWTKFFPSRARSSVFRQFAAAGGSAAGAADAKDVAEENAGSGRLDRGAVLQADSRGREELLTAYCQEQIASVLGLTMDRVDDAVSIRRLGVDSLMSVELRARITSDLAVSVPVAKILQGPSPRKLAQHIASALGDSPSL
ncbi:type I polyketide synthase [Streptomyces sp. H51]|uniref:type I polyketide synthase n=1 Tax=Streptomyces sp. H51 TaxID=3111770 RepID=UPI002D768C9B|nr:type I polyketide synthase [Streptomyces sp. H51]